MNKEEENNWFNKLKQFLHIEPKDKEQLVKLLRDAQIRALIDAETLTMIEGVILFSQMKVRDIMLPKNQITHIPRDADLNKITDIVVESGHSRFPITSENAEEVVGILHAKDLLRFYKDKEDNFTLMDIAREAYFVPESKRLDTLLTDFRSNRNHMAIVVDEYGTFSGFVTLEDIIEQIIGEIEDEFDIDEEAYIKSHGENLYIIKAQTPVADFNEILHANFSDEEYDTIGGIIMATLGHLPKCEEKITISDFEFKIINADARRIKLLECIDKRAQNNE